jgi:FG-GAP repeat
VSGAHGAEARIGVVLAVFLVLGSAVAAGAMSPPIVQKGKLHASDGVGLNLPVATSGRTIVVGAGSGPTGAVYVFERPLRGWQSATEVAKLTPSDTTSGAFGASVGIDGDTIIVGNPGDGTFGSAYVFERPAGGWTDAHEDGKLTPSGDTGFLFGESVGVSGDSAIVGAEWSKVGTHDMQGAAYVFVRPSGGWTDANETARLTTSTGVSNDVFASSVAIDGDTAVAGAPGVNVAVNTPNRGYVYVFVAPSGPDSWTSDSTPDATLVASEGATGDYLGFSVAISGPTLVAGAMQDDIDSNTNQGSGYLYERPAGGWTDEIESAHLVASDGGLVDRLGYSAAIHGDSVLLGSPGHDVDTKTDQGAAYLFNKPAGGWLTAPNPLNEDAKLVAADGHMDDAFGGGVGLSADTIVVGARGGSAYVFGEPKQKSQITLRIARTHRRVKARGRVKPPRQGETVLVTLYRKKSGRFHKLAAKHPQERGTGRYRTSFKRPNPGRCKVVARYSGNVTLEASRASKRFRC